MFLVNGLKATLTKYNRNADKGFYNDTDTTEVTIKLCPYNVDEKVNFGTKAVPEATGYYIVHRKTDVKEGDTIKFIGKYNANSDTYVILKVQDGWLFNRVENKILAVKRI
jgi:hypothetical protein